MRRCGSGWPWRLCQSVAAVGSAVGFVRPAPVPNWRAGPACVSGGGARGGRPWGPGLPGRFWAGRVCGYPVLLWLDPLALFSGVFGIAHNGWSPASWWSALGLAGVLLLSAVWPGFWCLRTCPLGAMQDGLACCGSVLLRAVGFPGSARKPAGTAGPTRRTVLGACTGVVGAAAGVALATWARTGRAAAARPLRPPGALDEARFAGVCVRCGNCSRACPAQIIRLDLGEHGIAGLLTPRLDFREDYCREDCTLCTEVCPSGALTEVTAREKPRVSIGFPRVDMNVCLLGNDRECSACENWCPYNAITYDFSITEYTMIPQIDPHKCPGCGACEAACPTRPKRAIVVEPR